jgi:hypothetical protein
MSRSTRKTPIFPSCCVRAGYLKRWKRGYNKAMRRHDVTEENPHKRQFSDPWTGPTDGKRYQKGIPKKEMSK